MLQMTIGPKYQVVIPKYARKIAEKIKKGAKVVVSPIDQWSVKISVQPSSSEWVKETKGMSKGLWKEDATKTIRKIRDEEWI